MAYRQEWHSKSDEESTTDSTDWISKLTLPVSGFQTGSDYQIMFGSGAKIGDTRGHCKVRLRYSDDSNSEVISQGDVADDFYVEIGGVFIFRRASVGANPKVLVEFCTSSSPYTAYLQKTALGVERLS